ncbi:MAG: ABC transporter permease [Desulfobacterales bacterium]|nr:ABC transporter permease [Desulfobacterales bacterium]
MFFVKINRFAEKIGSSLISFLEEAGKILLLLVSSIMWLFRRPFRIKVILKQMEFVGVNSISIVLITGAFSGMVFALQTFYGFRMFGGESLVGAIVALALTREIGPVFTALMVTGRAGSAMAAEIGTMRVTEQIDALYTMSVNPIQYLVTPRILAGIIMLPLLTIIADFLGVIGGYIVGVKLMGINHGIFMAKIYALVNPSDIYEGLIKSACFGLLLSLIGCYKGFYTKGGAEGVGKATTEAVVLASVCILVSDYILTAIMLK